MRAVCVHTEIFAMLLYVSHAPIDICVSARNVFFLFLGCVHTARKGYTGFKGLNTLDPIFPAVFFCMYDMYVRTRVYFFSALNDELVAKIRSCIYELLTYSSLHTSSIYLYVLKHRRRRKVDRKKKKLLC